jgi:hypothetical protein
MAEGRGTSEWDRTAVICTILANANRDPKKSRAFGVEDFTPYRQAVVAAPTEDVAAMKKAFQRIGG